jgi:hypothetical protein
MCHEYADLRYFRREAEHRLKESVREPTPAPAAEPAGGPVAVLRRIVEKVRPAKTPVAAE